MYKRAPLEDRLFRRKGGTIWRFWAYDYRNERYQESTHQTDWQAALTRARQIERDRAAVPTTDPSRDAEAFTLCEALSGLEAHDARVNAAKNTVEFHTDRARHLTRKLRYCSSCGTVVIATKTADDGSALETRTIGRPEQCGHPVEADGSVPCRLINREVMQVYSDSRLAEDAGRHTIQKEHRVLAHALKLAAGIGKYRGDITELRVEGFTKSKGKRGFYRPGDGWLERPEYVDALIAHTSGSPDRHRIDRRDDILTICNIGSRRRELLLICAEHVDLDARIVKVRRLMDRETGEEIRGVKTDPSVRDVPLNDVMVAMFRRRLRGAKPGVPLFTEWGSGNRDLKANWQRARAWLIANARTTKARARLEATLPLKLSFNDLRRTFCSLMKNAGVSFEDCAALLGHEDITMVKLVYGRTSMDTLHRAVAKLPVMSLPPTRLPVTKGKSRRQVQRERAATKKSPVEVSEVFVAATVAAPAE